MALYLSPLPESLHIRIEMRHLMPPYRGPTPPPPPPPTSARTFYFFCSGRQAHCYFFCQCYNSQSCRGCFSCGKGNLSGNWSWGGGRQEIHGDLNWWQFSGECRSQLRQSITRKKITKSKLRQPCSIEFNPLAFLE